MKSNLDIRKAAKEKGIKLYEIQRFMKLSQATFWRRIRKEFSGETKAEILKFIEDEYNERRRIYKKFGIILP